MIAYFEPTQPACWRVKSGRGTYELGLATGVDVGVRTELLCGLPGTQSQVSFSLLEIIGRAGGLLLLF